MFSLKKFILTGFLTGLLIMGYAQEVLWSDPIPVASSSYGNSGPRIVVNGNGDPVMLWSHEALHKVFLSRFEQGQMTTPQQINPIGTQYFGASWAGPELTAYGQDIYVSGKEQPEDAKGVSLFHSPDAGVTFSQMDDVDWALGDDLSRFPDVAAGPDGQVWVGFMRFEPDFSGARYVVSRSTDYGASFGEDVNASSAIIEGDACDCCAAQLAVGDNKLAMIYRNNDQNIRTIWAGISKDEGDTFSKGYEVDETGSYFASCPASAPDGYWAGNRLISTFRAAPGGRARVFFSVFDLDSQKVVLHQYLSNSPESQLVQDHPRITGNQDTVFLIWEESYAGNLDIKYRLSTTGPEGLVTAETKILNPTTNGDQLRPDVHYSNGRLHTVYQDNVTKRVMYQEGQIGSISSVDPTASLQPVRFSPNPSPGILHLPNGLDVQKIQVMDLFGRIVWERQFAQNPGSIQLSSVSSGLFQIVLSGTDDQTRYFGRLMIVN
ncbi:MAG: hypothetical protein K9I85_04200 [Saprospiraceae bacterium]|nr:hypothetical protein [Saprospiraceae bacterium]